MGSPRHLLRYIQYRRSWSTIYINHIWFDYDKVHYHFHTMHWYMVFNKHKEKAKIDFGFKVVETCDFHGSFGNICREMLILIYISSTKRRKSIINHRSRNQLLEFRTSFHETLAVNSLSRGISSTQNFTRVEDESDCSWDVGPLL